MNCRRPAHATRSDTTIITTVREHKMSYVDNSLLPNEQVHFRTRLHPIIFLLPLLCVIVSVILAIAGSSGGAGFFLVLALAIGLLQYIDFATSEFAVTDKRVIIKVGFIRRRTLEMLLQKVESIAVNQGILGRIFGYGNITVTGTGATHELFKNISGPLEFRRAVQAQTA